MIMVRLNESNLLKLCTIYFTLPCENSKSRTKEERCDNGLRYLRPSKLHAAGTVSRCRLLYLSVEERAYSVFPFNCSFTGPDL